ncbi:hypothetical protein GCM10025864_07430 [Luteimicrobium album]|uniref:Uncharacterized protein n=1 Tax=Luteimicrobium album TaxID=1054550 RepID=A0ABQ6HZN1_9MICO|nr:hypothetical protein GCM10025864_07430 [Luteimicrobium album]
MLDAHPDAAGLGLADEGVGDGAGEDRVLGVALEVAAAHGGALEVDLRGEDDVDAVAAGLVGEQSADAGDELEVPGGGDGAGCGERRGRLAGDVPGPPDTGRAVGDDDATEPDVLDRGGRPHAGADDERDLLLGRQLGGDRGELRISAGSGCGLQ